MRKDFMARPAYGGLLTLLPFAAALVSAFFIFSSSHLAHAQDFLAPPPGALTDGDDEEMNGAPPDLEHQEREATSKPSPGSQARPSANAEKVSPPSQSGQKVAAPITKDAATPATTSSKPAEKGEPLLVASHGGEDDIYDQWAAKKLKNQKLGTTAKPHPLALDHPGHFVVVCEAGCRKNTQHIVYMEPREARGPVYKTPAENTQDVSDVVACVGGCYGNGRNAIYFSGGAPVAGSGNSWMTTSDAGKKAKPAASDGRWYERINGAGQKVEKKATN